MTYKKLLQRAPVGSVNVHIPQMGEGCPEITLRGERLAQFINITKASYECEAAAILMVHSYNVLPEVEELVTKIGLVCEKNLAASVLVTRILTLIQTIPE